MMAIRSVIMEEFHQTVCTPCLVHSAPYLSFFFKGNALNRLLGDVYVEGLENTRFVRTVTQLTLSLTLAILR